MLTASELHALNLRYLLFNEHIAENSEHKLGDRPGRSIERNEEIVKKLIEEAAKIIFRSCSAFREEAAEEANGKMLRLFVRFQNGRILDRYIDLMHVVNLVECLIFPLTWHLQDGKMIERIFAHRAHLDNGLN